MISILDPVKNMFITLFKKRSGHLRMLLFFLIIAYGLMWYNYELANIEYLYMLKVFPTFYDAQYAYYYATR